MRTIAKKNDPSTIRQVDDETWQKMTDRGDSRKWTTVKNIPAPPTEAVQAMERVARKKKIEVVEEPVEEATEWKEIEQDTTE